MEDKLNIIIDSNEYDDKWPKYERIAVRGIVKKDNRYAFIKSDRYGDYKFPGGGREEYESDIDTLKREIFEETGISIDADKAVYFGDATELCHIGGNGDVYKHISHYYMYDMTGDEECISLDFADKDGNLEFVELETALLNNLGIMEKESIPWIERETKVMKKLQIREE